MRIIKPGFRAVGRDEIICTSCRAVLEIQEGDLLVKVFKSNREFSIEIYVVCSDCGIDQKIPDYMFSNKQNQLIFKEKEKFAREIREILVAKNPESF